MSSDNGRGRGASRGQGDRKHTNLAPSVPSEPGPSLPGRSIILLASLPVLLLIAGRFVAGPKAWGWNHFAYLGAPIFGGWIVLAIILLSPWGQRLAARAVEDLGSRLFETKLGPVALTLICGACFLLLPSAVFFLGDGYLIGELVAKGMPFRGFDNMDYRIHFLLYKALRNPADASAVSSFQIYQVGSALAGMIGTYLITSMTGRLRWLSWQKVLLVAWFLGTGSVVLFFGYVESYSFLYASLAIFSVAAILVLERRLPLWLASLAFGFAWFFHLTAIFSGVGLLFLALFTPGLTARKRWTEALVPAASVFAVSILAHVLGGFDQKWVQNEFFSSNAKSLLLPVRGEDGFLTLYHWKDLLNTVVLLFSVPVAILVLRFSALRKQLSDRRVQFLLLQIVVVGCLSLVLDRKLGGARDWDLLAAHSFPVLLLTVFLLGTPTSARNSGSVRPSSPHPAVVWAMTTALLVTAPWIWLQQDTVGSVARFESIAADFPRFARAYAYEELGKYFRKRNDTDRAKEMYELCAETYPANARFHVLLGSIYMRDYSSTTVAAEKEASLAQAVAEYREGVEGGSDHHMALSHLGKALYLQNNLPEAAKYLQMATEKDPRDPETWVQLGMVRLQLERMEEGIYALQNALSRNPALQVRQALGGALLSMGRNAEAERVFRQAIASPERNFATEYGLAAVLTMEADNALLAGEVADPEDVLEAGRILQSILQRDSTHDPARRLLQQLQDVQRRMNP